MPSGLLIIFLIVLGLILKKRYKLLSLVVFTVAGLTYFINTGIGTYIFVKPLETCYQRPKTIVDLNIDVVVILGGGIVFGLNDIYLNSHALQRVYEGTLMAKNLDVPIIVTGGKSPGRKGVAEASIMKEVIKNIGFEERKIISDPNARNTYENALYTYKICKREGFKNVLIVTSAVHMKRALKCFKLFNIKAIPYPVDYRYDYSRLSWIDFVPMQEALEANLAAIHEIIGLLWYDIKYF